MTIGAIATTRSSTAPVSHVVQPRFEPPVTTKRCDRLAFFLAEGLQGIHRPDRALGHGKEQRPVLVLGLQVADKSLGDQLVLFLAVQKRLIGHLTQHGDPCAAKLGQHESLLVVVVVLLAVVVAPRDEQEHGVGVGKLTRLVNRKFVLPGDSLPNLRGQGQGGDGPARRVLAAGLGPRKGGVGLLDVLVESRARRARDGGERQQSDHQDQGKTEQVTTGWSLPSRSRLLGCQNALAAAPAARRHRPGLERRRQNSTSDDITQTDSSNRVIFP